MMNSTEYDGDKSQVGLVITLELFILTQMMLKAYKNSIFTVTNNNKKRTKQINYFVFPLNYDDESVTP